MGVIAAFDGIANCACCPPGARKKLTQRCIPVSAAASAAFREAIARWKLPHDVIVRILDAAATYERVVATHVPLEAASSRGRGRQAFAADVSFASPSDLLCNLEI